ncbi:protection of telomeres protein 1 [Rhinophrynus dorsalis]
MPVLLLKDVAGPMEAQLPSNLRRCLLSELELGVTQTNRCFLGRIMLIYPSTKLGNGLNLLKTVLEDPSEEISDSKIKTIDAFFYGKIAEDCEKVIRQGDTLVISGFRLAKSTSASRDGRHHCQLDIKEENGATVYIFSKPGILEAAQAKSIVPSKKYMYTPLDQLKEGTVANIFGVVKFFKPPYQSKGRDFCSIVTIVDQSDVKLKCILFSAVPEALPKIYKVGDIVRFHRIKIQSFNNEIQGINSIGFSSLVFDGSVNAPVDPKTSSKCYSFTPEDKKCVEVLRDWAANHLNTNESRVKLSDIRPVQFFDLICQVVGKAEVDKSSYLLKVWDGTKCVSPSWKVCVEDEAFEGNIDFINKLQDLIVDILVYDNHVDVAKTLKIGSYIVIHSVHAKMHTASNENEARFCYVDFHLHGGTAYGRGISVLPEDNCDVQELQKVLDSVHRCLDYITSIDLTSSLQSPSGQEFPPANVLERCQQLSVTVLNSRQKWQATPLTTVIKNKAPQKYRIRARLRSFEPQKLYQSVKLHCTKCKSLQDVPNEDDLSIILQKRANPDFIQREKSTYWYHSAVWETTNQRNRNVTIHFVKKHDIQQNPEDTLIMIEASMSSVQQEESEEETHAIPPVTQPLRSQERAPACVMCPGEYLASVDLQVVCLHIRIHLNSQKYLRFSYSLGHFQFTALPFWAQHGSSGVRPGPKHQRNSALGIEPLRYVFVMHLTLDDGTGLLSSYLWNHAEQFFQISASEIVMDDKLQARLHCIMDTLCPPSKNISEHPWLDCCIKSYNWTDGRKQQICYEIFDTVITGEDFEIA